MKANLLGILSFALGWIAPSAHAQTTPLALVGGTLIDVTDYGHSARDIPDAVVVLRGDKIEAAGPRAKVKIPKGARVIECAGKFILPGLVDGFAGLNSQAQANATLYMGVTTIVGSSDSARGVLKLDAHPSPHVYASDSAGSTDDWSLLRKLPEWKDKLKEGTEPLELEPALTEVQLEAIAKQGTRVIWLGHNLTAANTKLIVAKSHKLGLITYGELTSTPYADGLADGIDSLLHMTRYELGLAPASTLEPLVKKPEDRVAYAPSRDYLDKLDATDPSILKYGQEIKAHNVALMPTFSLEYLVLPDHRNLWKEPAAAILDAKGLHQPPDRDSGEMKFASAAAHDRAFMMLNHFWAINLTLEKAHATYLAASGASARGTMPGISMHTELEMLVRLGLTPREALAAATNNYSDKFRWHELGLIATGRRADVLVLDANPIADIGNSRRISAVILNGVVMDREVLLKVAQ
jgi:hypothetical protein